MFEKLAAPLVTKKYNQKAKVIAIFKSYRTAIVKLYRGQKCTFWYLLI